MTAPLHEVRREDLISRSAAVKQLGVHRNTFDRVVRRLGFKRFKVIGDSQVFFLKGDIDAIDLIETIEEP